MTRPKTARAIFFAIFEIALDGTMTNVGLLPFGSGEHDFTLAEAVSQILKMMRAVQGLGPLPPEEHSLVRFFAWDREPLSPSTRFTEVPRPGVVLALKIPSTAWDTDVEARAFALTWELSSNPPQKLSAFLNGPDALVAARPSYNFDVFLSYSKEDLEYAKELRALLIRKRLSVFMAKMDISAGDLWSNRIRSALIGSRVGFVLITPNSIKSQWVICEAGALWALQKPIIPGLRYVKPEDLPQFINQHECQTIESTKGLSTCIRSIVEHCAS